ncbi:type ISP restriction/modification enzyme [Kocuria atrinae]|uniref:type ISP restriction/modification enzyme n=1 Tax=Kocuria atrinae TaxID=592377 RepID=UPI0002F37213|nr:type ISP restriction/modification enzyme [Kocuria atrinae]
MLIALKDPAHTGECELHYRDIGDYLSREQKLKVIESATLTGNEWQNLEPNDKGEWLNQSSEDFQNFAPLGDKSGKDAFYPIFRTYSAGLQSNRDSWVYNYSREVLVGNVDRMTKTYNAVTDAYQGTPRLKRTQQDVADWLKQDSMWTDPAEISWARSLRQWAATGKYLAPSSDALRSSMYRPFSKQHLYFAGGYNHERAQLPRMFPTPQHENYGFYLTGVGSHYDFTFIAVDAIPDLHLLDTGQFFPRYTYEPVGNMSHGELDLGLESGGSDVVVEGYRRIDNVSDDALARYSEAFGEGVTKDDIFVSVYAQLHDPRYREKYAADLKRQLPRIPLPGSAEAFGAYVDAGRKLMDLHIKYESVEPYPLSESHSTGNESDPGYYRVTKLRWGGTGKSKDRSSIVYNGNVTLSGIPDEAHEYMLGSRSALEWIMDRYQVKTDKASGIVNDPNDWAAEHEDPRYIVDLIKRVTTVSVETARIVWTLQTVLI